MPARSKIGNENNKCILYFINSVFLVQGKLSTTSLLAGEKTVGSDEQ